MFTGEEHTRIRSARSFPDLLVEIRKSLKVLGRVRMTSDGDFDIPADRFASFAWEAKIEGWVEPRKQQDEYAITAGYKLNPTAAGLIIGILFLMPVGLIFLFLGMNAQQDIRRRIDEALREIEDRLDERS